MDADAQPRLFKYGGDHGGNRAFAAGTGDVHHRVLLLWIACKLKEGLGAVDLL